MNNNKENIIVHSFTKTINTNIVSKSTTCASTKSRTSLATVNKNVKVQPESNKCTRRSLPLNAEIGTKTDVLPKTITSVVYKSIITINELPKTVEVKSNISKENNNTKSILLKDKIIAQEVKKVHFCKSEYSSKSKDKTFKTKTVNEQKSLANSTTKKQTDAVLKLNVSATSELKKSVNDLSKTVQIQQNTSEEINSAQDMPSSVKTIAQKDEITEFHKTEYSTFLNQILETETSESKDKSTKTKTGQITSGTTMAKKNTTINGNTTSSVANNLSELTAQNNVTTNSILAAETIVHKTEQLNLSNSEYSVVLNQALESNTGKAQIISNCSTPKNTIASQEKSKAHVAFQSTKSSGSSNTAEYKNNSKKNTTINASRKTIQTDVIPKSKTSIAAVNKNVQLSTKSTKKTVSVNAQNGTQKKQTSAVQKSGASVGAKQLVPRTVVSKNTQVEQVSTKKIRRNLPLNSETTARKKQIGTVSKSRVSTGAKPLTPRTVVSKNMQVSNKSIRRNLPLNSETTAGKKQTGTVPKARASIGAKPKTPRTVLCKNKQVQPVSTKSMPARSLPLQSETGARKKQTVAVVKSMTSIGVKPRTPRTGVSKNKQVLQVSTKSIRKSLPLNSELRTRKKQSGAVPKSKASVGSKPKKCLSNLAKTKQPCTTSTKVIKSTQSNIGTDGQNQNVSDLLRSEYPNVSHKDVDEETRQRIFEAFPIFAEFQASINSLGDTLKQYRSENPD